MKRLLDLIIERAGPPIRLKLRVDVDRVAEVVATIRDAWRFGRPPP